MNANTTRALPMIDKDRMPVPSELPEPKVAWQVDLSRAVLLLHDFQRYFLAPYPQDAEPITALLANTTQITEKFRAAGAPVAYTAQPGDMSADDRGLLRDFWGPGMTVDEADRAVHQRLSPQPQDWQFTKWRYSAFFRSPLLERMRAIGRDQVVITGLYGHVGIQSTAIEAYTNDIQTFVIADAIADFDRDRHLQTLNYVGAVCAAVVNTRGFLDMVKNHE